MRSILVVFIALFLLACSSEDKLKQEPIAEPPTRSKLSLEDAVASVYRDDLTRLKQILSAKPDLLNQWIYYENMPFHRATLLSVAAHSSTAEIFSYLLDIGANYYKDWDTSIPETAAASGNLEILKLIKDRGLELDLVGRNGFNALNLAIFYDKKDTAEFLLENGFTVHDKSLDGRLPIHFAAQNGKENVIPLLFEHGANMNATLDGRYPLHLALHLEPRDADIAYKHFITIEQLLEYGAYTHKIHLSSGETALHYLLSRIEKCSSVIDRWVQECNDRLIAYIDLLLDAGADINAFIRFNRLENCYTPLDSEYNSLSPNDRILEYLIRRGAKYGKEIIRNGKKECILSDQHISI